MRQLVVTFVFSHHYLKHDWGTASVFELDFPIRPQTIFSKDLTFVVPHEKNLLSGGIRNAILGNAVSANLLEHLRISPLILNKS